VERFSAPGREKRSSLSRGETAHARSSTNEANDFGLPRFARAAVLAHVTTHGMHHRAQCLNILRRLGVTPLRPSSVAEWTWVGETQM
jgi:uncharacterized damage-inducible protein DinB